MASMGPGGYGPAVGRLEGLRRDAADERLARALRREERKEIMMPTPEQEKAEELRTWARERVELRRRLRQRAAAFALGMLVLTPVWAVGEYLSSAGWPQRLSGNDNPGDWSPWIIWVSLAWGLYVALTALALHYRQPPVGEREIDAELARLAGHGHA
jgi:2TM domain